jgi:hypothetical protein
MSPVKVCTSFYNRAKLIKNGEMEDECKAMMNKANVTSGRGSGCSPPVIDDQCADHAGDPPAEGEEEDDQD